MDQHRDMNVAQVESELDRVLLTPEQIRTRVVELAGQVDADYDGAPLLLVGVLRGAMMIMADFARALESDVEIDWMEISSYGAGMASSGVVRILKDLDTDIAGRHVLVVEDVLDSGLTLKWLLRSLRARRPASIQLLTLLRKPEAVRNKVGVKYVGFDIEDEFVVGYGMDFNQRYRNLTCIGVMKAPA